MVATYLDHAATTPMRKSAIDAMVPFQDVTYANPSGSHRFAREARKAIDEARDDVASVIGCKPGEVIGGKLVMGAIWRRNLKQLKKIVERAN
ncbi:MAG: aminotransferase class V-fold PLP-dependent enzyme [Actinobacteria bacterium]|nr:aminotransferase class V-fold PLP-dependent enzyme [Actinomycetota bacterium]